MPLRLRPSSLDLDGQRVDRQLVNHGVNFDNAAAHERAGQRSDVHLIKAGVLALRDRSDDAHRHAADDRAAGVG